jgi:hypothetical protein
VKSSNQLAFLFAFIMSFSALSQQARYLFPIQPGQQNFLSGTMGELRSNHFHGGLDIKTGGRIGLPVYATADGYISRINITTGGYGHTLYLTHEDGYTSVYAHLDRFNDELESYIREKQYEKETYEIREFPKKDQFRFKQGDVIAFSGNTGSSSGPHLHFEIRDENHRFLNPLQYGFEEIKDNLPPLLKKMAFVTLEEDARINGAFGRYEFEVLKVNGVYTLRKPVKLSGKIGVEIYHYDHFNGTYHRNGIPLITYLVDDDTVFHQNKNSMSFGLNRHILAHMDYPVYAKRKTKFNKLFIDDGNKQDIYLNGNGIVDFDENKHYTLKLYMVDSYQNITKFEYRINNRRIVYPEIPQIKSFEVLGNTLQYVSQDTSTNVYYHYLTSKNKPYLSRSGRHYYLWDLDKGLPDSITSNSDVIRPKFYMTIPSGVRYSFYNNDFELESYRKTLFDTLHVRFDKSFDETNQLEEFNFYNYYDPLSGNLKIRLKPYNTYGPKSSVFSKYGSRISYVGGEMQEDGAYEFTTRNLGTFTIAYDSIAPTITPISWNNPAIKIKITDDLSGIKRYRATLDDQFLLMKYDAKKHMLLAQPKEPNKRFSGEFILQVEDNLGNLTEIKRQL